MFHQLRDNILRIDRAYGLEVSLVAGASAIAQLVCLKLKQNKIFKEKEVASIPMDDLGKFMPVGAPVAVVVNGKGVLHKKLPPQTPADNLFELVLPNGNPAEFYKQVCHYETFTSVYIIRKSSLDKLIHDLHARKFRILSVSMGVTDLQYVMPYINFESGTTKVLTNHFLLPVRPPGTIEDIEAIPFTPEEGRQATEYSIGNYYVFPRGLMAFAAAMGLLAGSILTSTGISTPGILSQREEYTYFKYFKAASWAFLAFLFSVLLINFFVYNHFYRKNEEQQASSALAKAEESQVEKRQSAVASRERLIGQYGWDRSPRISFYADRIAALVPNDAQLTGLKINPAHTSLLADNGSLLFQQDTIQLTGTCDNPAELNRFANNLRNIRDFRAIDIKSYLYKKEIQTGIFVMEIITI